MENQAVQNKSLHISTILKVVTVVLIAVFVLATVTYKYYFAFIPHEIGVPVPPIIALAITIFFKLPWILLILGIISLVVSRKNGSKSMRSVGWIALLCFILKLIQIVQTIVLIFSLSQWKW